MKTAMTYLGVLLATMSFGIGEAAAEEGNAPASGTEAGAQNEPNDGAKSSSESAEEKPQVLLGGDLAHGGYGAPQVKVTSVAGEAGLLVGGKGAWVIGHALTLGGGGYGLASRVDAPEQARGSATSTAVQLGYGGFRIGYIFLPQDMVHFSAGLLIGAGGISVVDRHGDSDYRTMHSASVFVLEPEAAIELNITRSIRGAIDVSYRYMSDSHIPGLSASKIGGPAAGATLAFGWF